MLNEALNLLRDAAAGTDDCFPPVLARAVLAEIGRLNAALELVTARDPAVREFFSSAWGGGMDGRRYRWLRDHPDSSWEIVHIKPYRFVCRVPFFDLDRIPATLDAAIDAAIVAKGGGL